MKRINSKKLKPTVHRNHYFDSDGNAYTELMIQNRLRHAYNEQQENDPKYWCEGCGKRATCHAHIIPKARCKQLRKTELIWNPENWFFSCFECNLIAENVSSIEITRLNNFQAIERFMALHDAARFLKLPEGERNLKFSFRKF